jgi:hypothetical protein
MTNSASLHEKALKKLKIEGTCLNITKALHDKLIHIKQEKN